MINQIGQVMLYVNDQDVALRFWKNKAGFVVVHEENGDEGIRSIEIAPKQGAKTSFVLFNKEIIAKMEPELNLDSPSIMFYTDDLDVLYEDYKNKGITVGDLVEMPQMRVFNFADDENNYFAVMEKK